MLLYYVVLLQQKARQIPKKLNPGKSLSYIVFILGTAGKGGDRELVYCLALRALLLYYCIIVLVYYSGAQMVDFGRDAQAGETRIV